MTNNFRIKHLACGVALLALLAALAEVRPAFGRGERLELDGQPLELVLVKNPAGFRLALASFAPEGVATMIAINDLDSDGRDVSLLWDVDFELLAEGEGHLSTTGLRGPDMANRLKYAGIDPKRIHQLPNELTPALDAFVDALPEGQGAYILPTYTAMLALRQTLVERGAVTAFWEQ